MFLPLPLGAASNISLREANDRGEMYSTRQSYSMQTGTVTSLLHQHLRSFLLGCLFYYYPVLSLPLVSYIYLTINENGRQEEIQRGNII